MKTSVDQRSRRKLIALTVSGVLLATLAAVGGYGFIVGTAEKPAPTATPRDPAPPTQPSPRPPTASRPKAPPIAPTRDPELFARRIAEAIFAWDTAAGLMPLDYTAAILAAGDTSGNEQAGSPQILPPTCPLVTHGSSCANMRRHSASRSTRFLYRMRGLRRSLKQDQASCHQVLAHTQSTGCANAKEHGTAHLRR